MDSRARLLIVLALLAAALLALGGCGHDAPTAASTATAGTLARPAVEGGVISGAQANGVWSYLGIPYAAQPIGELRWKPPQPVEPWKGTRSCVRYGPSCPQQTSLLETALLGVGRTSEDCLYLNVWTPARSPDE